jgi:flagellar biosynthesis/type III secretory pathway protein FliH
VGRLIKAADLTVEPEVLGRRGERAVAVVLDARRQVEQVVVRGRRQVIDLALAIARRIVGEAVELDPELLDRIYRRALDEVGELGPVAIHVHPDDRSSSGIDELARGCGAVVRPDPTVGRAGCRVEADGVVVEATLEAALHALGTELAGSGHG